MRRKITILIVFFLVFLGGSRGLFSAQSAHAAWWNPFDWFKVGADVNPAISSPVFLPSPGTYSSVQQVALSTSASGATIYFTLDGSTPTQSSQLYLGPITLNQTTTLKAKTFKYSYVSPVGWQESYLAAGTYTINVATTTSTSSTSIITTSTTSPPTTLSPPIITPASGNYPSPLNVTISSSAAGSSLRLTANNSSPSCTSPANSSPTTITLSAGNHTVKAIACLGTTDSAVSIATYSVSSGTGTSLNPPTFSPASGTYPSPQNVVISPTTPGSSFRFTTDNTEPIISLPSYSSSSTITLTTGTHALKAKAYLGTAISATSTAVYTVTAAANKPPEVDISWPRPFRISPDENLSIIIKAKDPDGEIAKVETWLDNLPAVEAKYDSQMKSYVATINSNQLSPGKHTLSAKAFDNGSPPLFATTTEMLDFSGITSPFIYFNKNYVVATIAELPEKLIVEIELVVGRKENRTPASPLMKWEIVANSAASWLGFSQKSGQLKNEDKSQRIDLIVNRDELNKLNLKSNNEYRIKVAVKAWDADSGIESVDSPVTAELVLKLLPPAIPVDPNRQLTQKCFEHLIGGKVVCGQVTDKNTGKPIAYAEIAINYYNMLGDTKFDVTYATAQKDGSYYVVWYTDKPTKMTVSSQGYEGKSLFIPSADRQQIDIQLSPTSNTGRISGKISNRQQIDSKSIFIASLAGVNIGKIAAGVKENGSFSFDNLPPGEFALSIEHHDPLRTVSISPESIKDIKLSSGQKIDNLVFELKNLENWFYGRVLLKELNKPPKSALVLLVSPSGDKLGEAKIDNNGYFVIEETLSLDIKPLFRLESCLPRCQPISFPAVANTMNTLLAEKETNLIAVKNEFNLNVSVFGIVDNGVEPLENALIEVSYENNKKTFNFKDYELQEILPLSRDNVDVQITARKDGYKTVTEIKKNVQREELVEVRLVFSPPEQQNCLNVDGVKFCFADKNIMAKLTENPAYYGRLKTIAQDAKTLVSRFRLKTNNRLRIDKIFIDKTNSINGSFSPFFPYQLFISSGAVENTKYNIKDVFEHEFAHLLDFHLKPPQDLLADDWWSESKFSRFQLLYNQLAFGLKIDSRYSGFGGHPQDDAREEFATLFLRMVYSPESYQKLFDEIVAIKAKDEQAHYVLCNEFNIIAKEVLVPAGKQILSCPTQPPN